MLEEFQVFVGLDQCAHPPDPSNDRAAIVENLPRIACPRTFLDGIAKSVTEPRALATAWRASGHLEADPRRARAALRRMNDPPYGRAVVLQTLSEVHSHRGWNLLATHVRANHLHEML